MNQPKNRCILIVEDNDVDRKFLTSTLEKKDYRVLSATNGSIALETAKTDRPDLIIADCDMPVMDGVTMTKKLKEDNDLHDIPILFLTGVDTPQNVIECFELEAENYLSKPVNPKILYQQVEDIFKELSA